MLSSEDRSVAPPGEQVEQARGVAFHAGGHGRVACGVRAGLAAVRAASYSVTLDQAMWQVEDGVCKAYAPGNAYRSWVGEIEARVGEIMTAKRAPNSAAASKNITKRIQELGDWRGETLAWVRQIIHAADPEIQEEWKWEKVSSSGTPVWSHDGIVCTGESYKQVVKLTFARGASLPDSKKLFNASLEGNTRRAIDIREGEKLNEAALKELIRSAVAANSAARARRASPKK